LGGTGDDPEDGSGEDNPGGVQGGPGRAPGGGGPRAAVHIIASRVQRPVRRPGRGITHRIRDRALPEPNGRA